MLVVSGFLLLNPCLRDVDPADATEVEDDMLDQIGSRPLSSRSLARTPKNRRSTITVENIPNTTISPAPTKIKNFQTLNYNAE